ncbi:MAG: Rpn family recombination-promoting nuclease/putative transposase, partial [Anaerolinea sp.]|nr:Rpn family recombination-promoting nuclease/putative transposase [Anaerolinea sp.]
MSETDNPLKLLIAEFAPAFAAWLLGLPVQSVRPLNVEFPSRPLRSDLLFEVLTRQGQKHLLHVELQGRRSHQPMPYRTLEYMSQTAVREIPLPLGPGAPRLHSVVLYVGEGAGREDNGRYTIHGLADEISLHWQYQVIRLWETPAASLLQLEQPALAALIGQTRMQQPEVELPRALQAIRSVADEVARQRLLTALVTLLPTEEVTQMVEKLLEESEVLLLDTPYLRRMRELGWQEG